jgi:hypothetical protein
MHAGEVPETSAVRAYPIPSPENDITGGILPAEMAGGLRIRMGNNSTLCLRGQHIEEGISVGLLEAVANAFPLLPGQSMASMHEGWLHG